MSEIPTIHMNSTTEDESDEHWCGWCRNHPESSAPGDANAVSTNWLIGTPPDGAFIWGTSQYGHRLHIHGAVITTQEQMTVKAALRRLWERKVLRKGQISVRRWGR